MKSHGRAFGRGTIWSDLLTNEEGTLQKDLLEARTLAGVIGAG